MNEIILAVGGLISTGGAAFFGWLFGRRKAVAEAEVIEANAMTVDIDNEIKLSEYYRSLLDDLKPRYENQLREFEATCKSREQSLNKQLHDVEAAYKTKEKLLREEITILRKENRILKAQVAQKDNELSIKTKRIIELESRK